MSYAIHPLLTGVRNPDQGIMTYQQGYGTSIWLPIWAFLLQGHGKNVLVDTGLDEDELIIPASFTEETNLVPRTLAENLQIHGLSPDDIDIVINTHLHDDHCGNNRLFTSAQFYANREEIDFCRNPHPLDHRYDEYFIEEIEFEELSTDQEIIPGLQVLSMPGHTVGCMSVRVETGRGNAIITGFCCNAKNFPANGPAVCPGVHIDARQAWDSIQKIKKEEAIILPMHDLQLESIPA